MRSRRWMMAFSAALALACAGFIALGVWQVQRLAWKQDLIARVEAHLHATPVAPPPAADWSSLDTRALEYRRIRLDGHFLPVEATHVQAVTELGAGFWLLSPFQLDQGDVVLVNRGFVPSKATVAPVDAEVKQTVIGLLRRDEPGGAFLRRNASQENRWFSRDVGAIAQRYGLTQTAPFFIDAEATPSASADTPTWPVAGLTVVRFPNNHLPYALTWFGLALMAAAGIVRLVLEQRRSRRKAESNDEAGHAALPDA